MYAELKSAPILDIKLICISYSDEHANEFSGKPTKQNID